MPSIVTPGAVRITDGEWLIECGEYANDLVEFEVAPDPFSAMRLLLSIAEHGGEIPRPLLPWIKNAATAYLSEEGDKAKKKKAKSRRVRRRAISLVIWMIETEGLSRAKATDLIAKRLIREGVPVESETIYQTWWHKEREFVESEKQRLAGLAASVAKRAQMIRR